jgi:hypothetical protein
LELSALDGDQTLGFSRFDFSADKLFPVIQLLKLVLNWD